MGYKIFEFYFSNKIQITLLLFISILPLISIATILRQLPDTNLVNEIHITIEGKNLKILGDSFNQIPSQVIINNINSNYIDGQIQISENNIRDINYIIIRWNIKITDCSYMFYNLINIINIDLSKFDFSNVINTSMMFAYCQKVKSLKFPSNITINTIQNMNSMFYNCYELESLDLSSFRTTELGNISSIFNGCNSLVYLDLSNWEFRNIIFSKAIFDNLPSLKHLKLCKVNSYLSSMRYVFSKLKYIISLDLSDFYTSNIIDMYGMFLNSTKLKYLDLTNFDTREVQIMWFMFDGCSSLTSLDLSSFDTSKVTDFDVVFRNLYSLNYIKLNFNLNSMVYKYSIFEGTSDFQYCIIDESKMIYFYNLIKSLKNTTRDCSTKCYPDIRILNIDNNKCEHFNCNNNITYNYIYKYQCVQKCPLKTYISPYITNLCEDLICEKFYNYEQNECITEIPEGYYLNDSSKKTIDKCHTLCRECEQKETINNNNCKSCFQNRYFYLGNCVNDCPNGFFTDTNDPTKKICKCTDNRCLECSMESLSINLCISCNNNYYPIFYNNNEYPYNKFYNCSKNPEGYYLDRNDSFYKKCYKSCKTCFAKGDEKNNNCLECKALFSFKQDFLNDTNCYESCSGYYYYDNQNKYHCTSQCQNEYNNYIEEKRRCIDDCSKDSIYKYKYGNKCYMKCPPKTKNNNYICEYFNCNFYYNFEQTDCINEIPEGFFLNDSYQKTIDKCHSICRGCDKKETIDNTNCISCFQDKYLYYGNCIDSCPNGYYNNETDNTIKICKCSNSKCLSCPLENTNLCYSCNEPYYQIYNDTSNIFPYVNCYKNPEGYYLDYNAKIYKPCYISCKTCVKYGDEKNNNCLECNLNYERKVDFLNDINCYKKCPFYYYFDKDNNYFCTNEYECPGNIYNKLIE